MYDAHDMYRWIPVLTLVLLGAAQASPLPELLQVVDQQLSVRAVQLQLRETQLKLNAPGVLPSLALKGNAGYGTSVLTGEADWSRDVGATVQYGFLTAPQQKRLLELEIQKLQADLTLSRISSLKTLLTAEHQYRKTQLALEAAQLDLQAQQLELKSRQARFALGAVTESQVKNAELLVQRAEVLVKQEQVALKKAVAELQRLKLSQPEVLPWLPLPPSGFEGASPEQLKGRKDLQELQVAGLKLNMANLPELALDGSYASGSNTVAGSINQNLDAALDYTYSFDSSSTKEVWNIKLSAKFPLDFTRGAQQQLNQQQQQLAQENLTLIQVQQHQSKTDALEAYEQNQELLELSHKVLKLSEDAVNQEIYRWKQGLAGEASVLQAQKELLKEKQNIMELEKTRLDLGLQIWEVYTWYPQNGK